MTNPYCRTLGIAVPSLARVKGHPEANTYALLIVALLEQGRPMTLVEVARRFEEAGVAPADDALRSLERCRPARAPVYRDGDRYGLDPHDDDLDLRVFMLGLRPPKVERLTSPRQVEPGPGPDVALTVAELREAWNDASLYSWSLQRLVLAVLDAHRDAMRPDDVVGFVASLTSYHLLRAGRQHTWNRGAAVRALEDGRWTVVHGHDALIAARRAVRDRLAMVRRWAAFRSTPEEIEASRRAWEERRAAHEAELAKQRCALLHAFPPRAPEVAAVVDVKHHQVVTYLGAELAQLRERLAAYDLIGAMGVRSLLRNLGFDPGERRLADLAPPQKTKRLNRRGRTLEITASLLVWGSCGISHAFGAVRLRWGFLDEMIPAPWLHRDETTLYDLMRRAVELNVPVDVVAGSAPSWSDPWSRALRCEVAPDSTGLHPRLVAEDGGVVDPRDVQLVRLVVSVH